MMNSPIAGSSVNPLTPFPTDYYLWDGEVRKVRGILRHVKKKRDLDPWPEN